MNDYGGKANSLMKLRDNNFNVPPFFLIDSSDFNEFLAFNHLNAKIKMLFYNKEYEKIQNLIMNGKMSPSLKNKLKNGFQKLNSNLVSVRSSASNEDGKMKSFAGQYRTLLNVSFEKLYESVKLCWCSLYSENVILYSDAFNLSGMNLIVQKMIQANYSGVAFSLDPNGNTKNYSVIEIIKGLGEKLVSGEQTPTKFIVRRETLKTDLKIGNLMVDTFIENIEKIVLSIEQLFNTPIDVEFAIAKKEIFILQARPITAITPTVKTFSSTICRPSSLIEEEIYFHGEFTGIKGITKNLYYFKPFFIYNPINKNTEVYYNELDLEEDPRLMYYYMDLDYDNILLKYEKVKKYSNDLYQIIEKRFNVDIDSIIDKLIYIYPFSSLGQLAGHFNNITDRVRKLLFDFRNHYDDIIHKTCDYLLEKISKEIPKEYQKFIKFITLEEYKTKHFPSIHILEKRKKGYIYFDGSIITDHFYEWFQSNNIAIKQDEAVNLKGNVVYGNNCEGKICKIFNEEDFDKFEEGDIIVTPMTTPKFIKILKKAKAIITDEGGITCHAAIISRELKIVCIVGCKNATKLLEDGDHVKINGSTGEIFLNYK